MPWQVWEAVGRDPAWLAQFGHGEDVGFWFVRVNLARDFLALTKQEVSDWDTWREQQEADKAPSEAAMAECDDLAAAAKHMDIADRIDTGRFDALRRRIQTPHWHR